MTEGGIEHEKIVTLLSVAMGKNFQYDRRRLRTMEQIASLIQSVGFPIACTIALFWHIIKMQEQHKEEMLKLTEALKNNTVAIIELKNSLDDVKGGKQ